jgi:hypothetical protein
LCLFNQLSGVGGRSDWQKCEQDIEKEKLNYLTCSKRKKTCDHFLSKQTGSRNNNSYPNFLGICDFEDVNYNLQVVSFKPWFFDHYIQIKMIIHMNSFTEKE